MQRVIEEMVKLRVGLSSEAQKMAEGLGGGKMLRAKLLLHIAPHHPLSPRIAAIIEFIHAASLLHDDVIDEARLRRGLPSVNALYGNKSAVMLGDILYSQAYSALAEHDPFLITTIAKAVVALSEGELADVRLSQEYHEDESAYMAMIEGKTAALIEATAVCGAFLAGLPIEPFALYGRNLGLAFQIVDDLLDVTQDEATLGKPAMGDLAEGKMTLPYLIMVQKLDDNEKVRFRALHSRALDQTEASWIKEIMLSRGVIDETTARIRWLGQQAMEALANAKIDDSLMAQLQKIMDAMTQREF
ncbi:MAG: polyprenyl synthetase family protein [Campylobacterales bacterium]